jgi:hypothetical protein
MRNRRFADIGRIFGHGDYQANIYQTASALASRERVTDFIGTDPVHRARSRRRTSLTRKETSHRQHAA